MNIKEENILFEKRLRSINKKIRFKQARTIDEYKTDLLARQIIIHYLKQKITPVYENW